MSSNMLEDIFGQNMSYKNNTMFHIIAKSGYNDIMDYIWNGTKEGTLAHILKLKNNDGETCLHIAAKYLKGEEGEVMMAQMADMGAELDAQEDNTGNTVLHVAVECKNYRAVAWLLSMGAHPDITNNNGLTPCQIAEQQNDQEMKNLFD